MKAGLRNPLSWLLRAGFLTRLSNLIIIQGLFVFAAVALLVFFPQSEKTDPSDITHYSAELESARKEIASVLPTSDASASRREQADPLQAMLQSLFRRLPDLGEIQIFTTHSDQGLIPIVKSKNPGMEHDRRIEHQELDNLIDPAILRTCLQNPDQRPLTSLEPAQHLVSYHPFQFDTGIPAVLVALTKHDLVISHRSQLKYALFVLFLCSTLISLLTIYLIANRFKGPLDRLIQGFEKTAAGELFFIFEARGDAELRQLAAAFNTMSQKLWQNHKRLKESYFLMTRANRGLLASQLFLATLIDSSPSGVLAADEQGKIMIFNRQASEQFGIDQDSALGRDIDTLFVGSGGNRFCRRSNGGPANGEVLCRRQDGSLFPAYVIASPIATRERHIVAHLFIIRDITES
ncbi:MAG TPA: PAS domain S-box protein, partial [Candidatus Deferrimicrobium sp.]|nr:PAS domain S-box protein [Candidatus Deferrimicrobium sp.]